MVSRVANGLPVSSGAKVTDAKVLYPAFEAAWGHLHSSCNSVAFGHGLILSKATFPSHVEETRCLQVSREDVSSCVFPEAAIAVGIAGEEEEGWCLCKQPLL